MAQMKKAKKDAQNFLVQDVASGHFLTRNDTFSADASDREAVAYVSAKIAQNTIDEIGEEVRDHTDPKPHPLAGLTFRVYDRENPPVEDEEPSEPFEGPADEVTADYEIVEDEAVQETPAAVQHSARPAKRSRSRRTPP
jgi:hypothetical protein